MKYDLYGQMLYRLGMAYLAHPAECEDAMQETFIKLLYRAPAFQDGEHEKRWLLRVMINTCKNRLAAMRRGGPAPEDIPEPACRDPEDGEVLQAVFALPPIYKDAMHLHYIEGYSIKEIAQILGSGVPGVKMRLSRGRAMLKMDLEEGQ